MTSRKPELATRSCTEGYSTGAPVNYWLLLKLNLSGAPYCTPRLPYSAEILRRRTVHLTPQSGLNLPHTVRSLHAVQLYSCTPRQPQRASCKGRPWVNVLTTALRSCIINQNELFLIASGAPIRHASHVDHAVTPDNPHKRPVTVECRTVETWSAPSKARDDRAAAATAAWTPPRQKRVGPHACSVAPRAVGVPPAYLCQAHSSSPSRAAESAGG